MIYEQLVAKKWIRRVQEGSCKKSVGEAFIMQWA